MNKLKLSQLRVFFLVGTCLLLSICILISNYHSSVVETSLKEGDPYTIVYKGALIERDLTNLFETSNLVVFCTITSEPDSFGIRRVDTGGIEILSDQFAKVNKVIMGTPVSDTIVIRLRGGTVGKRTEIYEENPVLEVGKQYLLFLNRPDRGGTYHTAGDYYYVRGLHQGAFEVFENGEFISSNGVKLAAESLVIPDSVYQNGLFSMREDYIYNQKQNLEHNMLSQEGFDRRMEQLDQYAEIIDDSEVE